MADAIVDEGPWLVMGCHFSIHRRPNNLAIEEMPLHLVVTYWIQAQSIPTNLLTIGNALEIEEKLGTVVQVENPWRKGPRGFLRIRV
ncbi:hypothetical protein CerSpe_022130 [Prunus speciosa]